jgi:hypothetical protein
MSNMVRDFQIRHNSLNLPNSKVLIVDGEDGPNTKNQTKHDMSHLNISDLNLMFDASGIKRVHWHWTASTYRVTDKVKSHYNHVYDHNGIEYEGGSPAIDQADYSPNGKGVSHTLNANTGAVGLSCVSMAGADVNWGTSVVSVGEFPITWDSIDSMLKRTAFYCKLYDIKPSRWTTLTHCEVQTNIGIRQRGKWDIRVLPNDLFKLLSERQAGDILRKRMQEKFF